MPRASRFRLYEMSGAAHMRQEDAWPGLVPPPRPLRNFVVPTGLPGGVDACRADFPKNAAANSFPLHHYAAAAYANLWDWVLAGKAPPPGALIETDAAGAALLDQFGNAKGGARSSDLDVPAATYGVGPKGGLCALPGYTLGFDAARLRALYGDPGQYRARVGAALDALVAARRLRPREAALARMTAERRW